MYNPDQTVKKALLESAAVSAAGDFDDPGSIPHALSARQAAALLNTAVAYGLSNEEADRRLLTDGPNTIEHRERRRWRRFLLEQFSSIVIWLLAAAAFIAFISGNELEAAAILVVLILNAAIGSLIEWQAGRALEALRRATSATARVRRGRAEKVIDAKNLVAGDVIILSAGDLVPADARILESANLRTDESTLTGESAAVEKDAAPVEIAAPLAERRSMLFLGTIVVAGRASAIVTATGERTQIGHIGQLVAAADEGQTPLQRRLNDLGKRLVYVVLGIALVVFLAGSFRGDDIWLMLEVSISLAVAAVPEGLPAVTTLILALGVLRMARRSAIVRKLAAVETLGSSTIICTDKTGTLTENRMTVREYSLADERNIEPPPGPTKNAAATALTAGGDDNLLRVLRVGVLCNEATITDEPDGGEKTIGDPTETALLSAAQKFGLDPQHERSVHELLFERPFDAATRKMIVVVGDRERKCLAAMKGAPSVVLDACRDYFGAGGQRVPLNDAARARFLETNRAMADRALRVLAFAEKQLEPEGDFQSAGTLEAGYTFAGFAGMSDPPRNGAAEAVKKAQEAGIRVVMLTGDQTNTARAVARELNLGKGGEIIALHSKDLAGSGDDRIAEMARRAHVFARVSPEDKLNIVKALQKTGGIVAVTGDGVNDAPALKHADIGIAMGLRGTEVAKEASDIVLTDDNFTTIVKAIESGRTIYANILRFVHLMFTHNLGEVLVIFAAIIAGLPLPLMPLQILWINLVTDVFPALALAVEPPSPKTMNRRPHAPGAAMLSRKFMVLIAWQGAMLAVIALGAYLWALNRYGPGPHARTIALLSLIAVQLGHMFNCRSRSRSAFNRFFSNPFVFVAAGFVIVLQLLALYFPPLARILDTFPPNRIDYLVILLSLVLPVVVVEIVKAGATDAVLETRNEKEVL